MNDAHILIVENEKIVVAELKTALLDFGYPEAVSTTMGEKALEIVQTDAIDLVLMDIKKQHVSFFHSVWY